MAENPAKHFRLDHVKGALKPGRDADIMVLTPEVLRGDTAKSGNSVAGWSPFDGIDSSLQGRGDLRRRSPCVRRGQGLGGAGHGRFVRPPERILVADQAA